jgi:hypothetical protein
MAQQWGADLACPKSVVQTSAFTESKEREIFHEINPLPRNWPEVCWGVRVHTLTGVGSCGWKEYICS